MLGHLLQCLDLSTSVACKRLRGHAVSTRFLSPSSAAPLHVSSPDEKLNTHYALGRAGKGMAASSNVAVDA